MNTDIPRLMLARPETLPAPPDGLTWAIGETGWELCPINEIVEVPFPRGEAAA